MTIEQFILHTYPTFGILTPVRLKFSQNVNLKFGHWLILTPGTGGNFLPVIYSRPLTAYIQMEISPPEF